jgi:protein NrfD
MTTISSGLSETVHRFSLADDALIVVEFAILGGLFLTLQHGCNAAQRTVESLNTAFFSEFFVGVIGLGLILPLVMSLAMTGASWWADLEERSRRWRQVFTAGYTVKYGLVLFGGYLLRYVIIFAAIKLPLNVP